LPACWLAGKLACWQAGFTAKWHCWHFFILFIVIHFILYNGFFLWYYFHDGVEVYLPSWRKKLTKKDYLADSLFCKNFYELFSPDSKHCWRQCFGLKVNTLDFQPLEKRGNQRLGRSFCAF